MFQCNYKNGAVDKDELNPDQLLGEWLGQLQILSDVSVKLGHMI